MPGAEPLGPGQGRTATGGRGIVSRARRVVGAVAGWAEASYHLPYRSTMARARADEDDLFLLMVAGEALGLPNPMGYHSLELLPAVYERFHAWHQRMGMDRSPLDHLACC
ncbi:hypothetical protein SAMN05445756_1039 [Kytococcus aerolatus]|uniref:DNA helicase n=1 Tax=Kytococcus aerolatus TaxID=592308 RepID=A0A212TDI8_9MICO|nr:hypothetical protein SAMN05445756_1039 [Kytococcus aerolatus]